MSEEEERSRIIDHWLARAQESLESASDELASGRILIAINRVYYALFYAASAALLADGRQFAKHAGVRAGVNLHLVRTGKLPLEMGAVYNELFEDRHDADYEAFFEMEASLVRERIEQGKTFLALIVRMLGKEG
jgi:uncharacterized protein (UPF0332 family)